MDSAAQIAAWLAAAGTVGGIVGACAREAVNAILKLRGARLEERKYEDGAKKDAYEILAADHQKRIGTLEGLLGQVQNDHLECVKQTGILQGQTTLLAELNKQLTKDVQALTEEVNRLTRHEKANVEQVKRNIESAEQLKSKVEDKLSKVEETLSQIPPKP